MKNKYHCGFIAIIGKSNVGKSTLFNKLLGKKVSITSSKINTTKNFIKGIYNNTIYQSIYIDTPGFTLQNKKFLNNFDNVNLIIFVVAGTRLDTNDNLIINYLKNINIPVFLVINKMDVINNKFTLLPYIKFISSKINFLDIFIVSAKKNKYVDKISNIIQKYLPEKKHCFPKNIITDCSQKFLVSEIIREQCMRLLGHEMPYIINIKIEKFIIYNKKCFIDTLIFVKNRNQKKIIIGKNGDKIKKIVLISSKNIKKIIQVKINLKIWIQIRH